MSNTLKTIPTYALPDFLNKKSLEDLALQYEGTEGAASDIATIKAFIEEMDDSGCDDWNGCGLISDGLPFSDYIRETVEDCEGESLKALPWFIQDAIDWEEVTQSLKSDFTDYSFGGLTYWGR